jgi:hypothetical protein
MGDDDSGGGIIIAFFLAALMMSLYVTGVMGGCGVFAAGSSVDSTRARLVDGRTNSCGCGDSVRSNGLLLFLTRENVLDMPLSNCVGVLGALAFSSSCCPATSSEYVLPLAYGSMLRNGGLFFTDSMLPFLAGCTGDGTELAGVDGRSTGDCADEAVLGRVRVAMELGEMDRLLSSVRSTIDGLPE